MKLLFVAMIFSALGQSHSRDIVFKAVSDSIILKLTLESPSVTDMYEAKEITNMLKQNAVPEKELLQNRLYRKTLKSHYKIKMKYKGLKSPRS